VLPFCYKRVRVDTLLINFDPVINLMECTFVLLLIPVGWINLADHVSTINNYERKTKYRLMIAFILNATIKMCILKKICTYTIMKMFRRRVVIITVNTFYITFVQCDTWMVDPEYAIIEHSPYDCICMFSFRSKRVRRITRVFCFRRKRLFPSFSVEKVHV